MHPLHCHRLLCFTLSTSHLPSVKSHKVRTCICIHFLISLMPIHPHNRIITSGIYSSRGTDERKNIDQRTRIRLLTLSIRCIDDGRYSTHCIRKWPLLLGHVAHCRLPLCLRQQPQVRIENPEPHTKEDIVTESSHPLAAQTTPPIVNPPG